MENQKPVSNCRLFICPAEYWTERRVKEEISSKENRMIKLARKLARKKYRDEFGQFLAEGLNLIDEALRCGAGIQFVLMDQDERSATHEARVLEDRLRGAGIPVHAVESSLFRELADTETPQCMLGVIGKKVYTEYDIFSGDVVVLDRLQDPGNLGTILRTADAAGFRGAILMKGCGDVFSPKTVRATAGSIFRVPVISMDAPEEAVALLKNKDYSILCTTPAGTELPYDIDMRGRIALVVGNEAGGACGYFQEHSHHLVRIPMAGPIESLNASVAAGIMMYEAVRQKSK